MPKIIVIQTAGTACDHCLKAALEVGIDRQDIQVYPAPNSWIEEDIVRDEDQLLITGTHYGYEMATNDFVRRMKKKNPRLKAWFCSLMKTGDQHLYERSFGRNRELGYHGRYVHLMTEAKKFIDGIAV